MRDSHLDNFGDPKGCSIVKRGVASFGSDVRIRTILQQQLQVENRRQSAAFQDQNVGMAVEAEFTITFTTSSCPLTAALYKGVSP